MVKIIDHTAEVKYHLTKGLLTSGLKVIDVGLALSPMVYFAQHHLDTDSLAMVTASHNENGWTGIKCGIEKSLTFGPDDIKEIKTITENSHDFIASNNGSYEFKKGIRDAYLKYLKGHTISKKKFENCYSLWQWNSRCICP